MWKSREQIPRSLVFFSRSGYFSRTGVRSHLHSRNSLYLVCTSLTSNQSSWTRYFNRSPLTAKKTIERKIVLSYSEIKVIAIWIKFPPQLRQRRWNEERLLCAFRKFSRTKSRTLRWESLDYKVVSAHCGSCVGHSRHKIIDFRDHLRDPSISQLQSIWLQRERFTIVLTSSDKQFYFRVETSWKLLCVQKKYVICIVWLCIVILSIFCACTSLFLCVIRRHATRTDLRVVSWESPRGIARVC